MTLQEAYAAIRLRLQASGLCRYLWRILREPVVLLFGAALFLCGPALSAVQAELGYAFAVAIFLTLAATWELQILGDPHNPTVWPAHLLLLFVLTLFFTQTLSLPAQSPLPVAETTSFGWLGDAITQLLSALRDAIPDWITRFFVNWRFSLLLLLFFCAMCIRHRRFRICLFRGMLLFPWISTLLDTFSLGLLLGGVLLILACERLLATTPNPALQAGALKLQPLAAHDPDFVVDALRILDLLKTDTRHPVSEIEAVLPHSEPQIDRMIHLGLLEMEITRDGKLLRFDRTLTNPSPLILLARIPRTIFLLIIVCIWVALPIDLIPDAIPFIGSLDDLTLSMLALHALREKRTP